MNKETPAYLQSLLPDLVGDLRPTSRYATNYYNHSARTETFKSSFILSAIDIWNNSGPEARSISSVVQTMKFERKHLFYVGKRNVNILHAQLRLGCSKLNSHLFSLHVIDSPACICGSNNEDSEHFLLYCPLYDNIRRLLIHDLATIIDNQHLSTETLLYGNDSYDLQTNIKIFEVVQTFLLDSNRL